MAALQEAGELDDVDAQNDVEHVDFKRLKWLDPAFV